MDKVEQLALGLWCSDTSWCKHWQCKHAHLVAQKEQKRKTGGVAYAELLSSMREALGLVLCRNFKNEDEKEIQITQNTSH